MRRTRMRTRAEVNAQFQQDMVDMVADLHDAFPGGPFISLVHPPPAPAPDPAAILAIQTRVADYLKLHPDTIQGTAKRPTYSLEFVGVLLDLMASGAPADGMCYGDIAAAAGMHPKTLYDWVHNHNSRQIRLLR